MLHNLDKYHILLGSQSPRRKELLSKMGIKFEIRFISDPDEKYPDTLKEEAIVQYLARKKADIFFPLLTPDNLLITADTIVCFSGEVLEKPADRIDAIKMLKKLSGNEHTVYTGVALTTKEKQICFHSATRVFFADLEEDEIIYYTDTFRPYDKAGAYGIQEWIGYIGVKWIQGCFYNVMGLPTQELYNQLKKIR